MDQGERAGGQGEELSRYSGLFLRAARAGEGPALSELCMRSKAVWGYDAAFMESCREELTVTRERIAAGGIIVAEAGGEAVGLVEISGTGATGEVALLFVAPGRHRAGVGRALWQAAERLTLSRGYRRLRLDADPHAVGFYLRMGCHVCGASPSGAVEGRTLPQMEKAITPPPKRR